MNKRQFCLDMYKYIRTFVVSKLNNIINNLKITIMKESIFIVEQRENNMETWHCIVAAKTEKDAEKWIEELKDSYRKMPIYGEIPQFRTRKLYIY